MVMQSDCYEYYNNFVLDNGIRVFSMMLHTRTNLCLFNVPLLLSLAVVSFHFIFALMLCSYVDQHPAVSL